MKQDSSKMLKWSVSIIILLLGVITLLMIEPKVNNDATLVVYYSQGASIMIDGQRYPSGAQLTRASNSNTVLIYTSNLGAKHTLSIPLKANEFRIINVEVLDLTDSELSTPQ